MSGKRDAWEPHTLDAEQLDIFANDVDDAPTNPGAYDEPGETERVYQLTELPGETWADIFGDAA
jgi:hypothetical protein